ncbi:MAG: ABC transporter ATP-binding protein [Zestosphaera sp.]
MSNFSSLSEVAVEVKNLRKDYGGFTALRNISFSVKSGEVYGLVGPNGAGKTTTLRIIATLIRPTAGEVSIHGLNVVKDDEKVRKLIAYLPEEAGSYKHLTGREYLRLIASVYGYGEEVVNEAVEISGLGRDIDKYTGTYSKGMKRRLQVARALMVKPRVAILDEPTSGLDVIHAVYIRKVIKEYSRRFGITFIVSSHNMLEVEYLCDRIALIDRGLIVTEGRVKELLDKHSVENLEELFTRLVGPHA